jgi:two-component system sensor histidine kinase/response regulator
MSTSLPETGLDRHVALLRVGGDEELLKEIAAIFLEECPRMLAAIRSAITDNNPRILEESAHALKGSVGNFGARAAVESALRLEQMGRNQRIKSQALDASAQKEFDALDDALGRLRLELEAL